MGRYLLLLAIQFRASALVLMQYRLDFVIDAVMGLFWSVAALVPLLVLFENRTSVAGWAWSEALLVLGFFQILRGVIDGAIQPSLRNVVEHIRKGTLDFLILKPVDAQFMVSTAHFEPWRGTDTLGGLALVGWALYQQGRWPTAGGVLMALLLLGGAVVILYSTWIVVVSLAFLVMKVDELSFLLSAIYDLARWPSSIFRGTLSVIFTMVIPLAVMTTFPALALLGRLSPGKAALALLGALVIAALARAVWQRALRHYTGAGG